MANHTHKVIDAVPSVFLAPRRACVVGDNTLHFQLEARNTFSKLPILRDDESFRQYGFLVSIPFHLRVRGGQDGDKQVQKGNVH